MVNMWLSAWVACSVAAACARADPSPSPAPLLHQSTPSSGESGGAGGGGGGHGTYGWQETRREGARDGQFYVQLQDGGAGTQHSVQYTADEWGYHPLIQYHDVGAQHTVSSSFALGQRALDFLHGNQRSAINAEQQPSPSPPANEARAPETAAASPQYPQYSDPRDYYLVTQQYISSPDNLNAQIQGIAQFATQESNANALAQYNQNEPLVRPVQYVVQHPPHQQYVGQQNNPNYNLPSNQADDKSQGTESQQKNEAQIKIDVRSQVSENPQENDAQVSNPSYHSDTRSHSQDYAKDELTTPLIQVFTDHNCTEQAESDSSSEPPPSYRQSANLYAEIPSYDERNIYSNYDKSFGSKVSSGEKANRESKTGGDRHNSRSERLYMLPTVAIFTTMTPFFNVTEDGISKLVASTQNLISNDDLLDINHAAEEETPPQNDDIIRPQSNVKVTKLYPRNENNSARSRITVSAKIGKLVDTFIEHEERPDESRQELSDSQDQYQFATPIVVQGSTASDFKTQIMDSIMSTVSPYFDDGYELTAVRNHLQERPSGEDDSSDKDENKSEEDYEGSVKVTPRPVSQKFLAPLTVGLRLIHSNNTDVLNNVDGDHEVSDSELVSDAVKLEEEEVEQEQRSARRGKTIVEVQRSIPIEYTEINDIVIHNDDSRDGKRAQELKSQFNQALESSKKIQNDMNQKLYRYGAQQVLIHPEDYRSKLEAEEKAQQDQENHDSREDVDSSDIQTEIEVQQQESQQNERKEFITAYNNHFGEKIIQPIIIEKEVPVTKYVDRFIEKKVPYPQTVEVIKEVSVDKPVPYAVTKYIDRPVEVTRYVDRPRNIMVAHPVPYEVKVPYPVEKKVYVDRPIHVPYAVEKVVEKQVQVSVPTPVGIPVPVEQTVLYPVPVNKPYPVPYAVDRPVPVDRIVEKEVQVPYAVEKRVPYPVHVETKVGVPYPVEKLVPYSVDRIVEKPVTVTKYVDRPYHVGIPVPQPVAVPVPQPYPVDRIVEKRVPYPVDRVVEKRVPYPVDRVVEKIVEKKVQVPVHVKVPYPVEKIVEKIVTKYVDKPYPVEKRVPYPVPYEKIVEKRVPYAVHVKVPYEVKVPYPVEKVVDRPIHVSYKASHSDNTASYALPGPPYHHHSNVDHQPGHSSPQNYVAASQVNPTNAYSNPPTYTKPQNGYSNTQNAYSNPQNVHSYPQNAYFNPQNIHSNQQNAYYNLKNQQSSHNSYLNSAFIPAPSAQTPIKPTNFSNLNPGPGVKTTQWGNLQASTYQYIKPKQPDASLYQKTPNFGKHIGYLTNTFQYNAKPQQPDSNVQYNGKPEQNGQVSPVYANWSPPRVVEWKLRRTDRTPRVAQLRIEYGGFKPPLVPSTEVDLDGLPVMSEGVH